MSLRTLQKQKKQDINTSKRTIKEQSFYEIIERKQTYHQNEAIPCGLTFLTLKSQITQKY